MKSILLFFATLTLEKKTLLLILTPIFTVLLSIQSILLGLLFFIFLDLITGLRKSLYIKGTTFNPFKISFWKTLTSSGMRETWRKGYEYGIGIIVFAVMESIVFKIGPIEAFNRKFSLTELAVVIACVIEIWSIFENMEAVSGNNLLKKVLHFVPKPIRDAFKKVSEK